MYSSYLLVLPISSKKPRREAVHCLMLGYLDTLWNGDMGVRIWLDGTSGMVPDGDEGRNKGQKDDPMQSTREFQLENLGCGPAEARRLDLILTMCVDSWMCAAPEEWA